MIVNEEEYLAHYGTPRKSGRYPWGSGGTESQRNKSLLDHVENLRRQGMSETDIAKGLEISTTQLRAMKSIAKNEQKQADINMARRLQEKGLSNVAIGERMGINESSVRSLLAPAQKDRADVLQATASMLKGQVDQKRFVDIGSGVENHIGVSQTKLATAVAVLKQQGYTVHYVKVEQLGTGNQTTIKVLAPPDTPYSEVFKNRDKIQQVADFSDDGGRSYSTVQPPISVDSKRIAVRYAEQGGADSDGVIFVRPGVDDLSLGSARYAQVRVAVDGSHYLKGMAMYKTDLPDGVDLMFNTNKSDTGNKTDAMKPLKDDAENPFGSAYRQLQKLDADGHPIPNTVRSAMNIVNEEGDWEKWSRSLSSQFLSKQSPKLAQSQLNMTLERKQNELDEIMKLTNPAVRKKLLESYSDDADSSAVHLKAAILPRTANHVILPINSLKETEIYAPNYRNGEKVVLVRHPHGGPFEIPELTVNNNHPEARKILGGANPVRDAVGINSKVAERLSGADFDGDTVLVIPNNARQVKTAPALAGLKNFDPKAAYPPYEGMPKMSPRTKQIEMGKISNLITDMTIRGANNNELARAVRHSMVVIDAEKHNLDYRSSARDNGISELKAKYQGQNGSGGGASTLISRAGSSIRVNDRKPRSAANGGPIDKATGQKVYEDTGVAYVNRKGDTVVKSFESTKLAETHDAHTLSSGTPVEEVYANHSNSLKALANQARKVASNTQPIPYSPSAKATYSAEVSSLDAKLNLALRNRPLERQAQVLANTEVAAKRQANPEMDSAELKKLKSQALLKARNRTGAKKQQIELTDSEWNAIQAGAISNNKLNQILNNSNLERIKELATPKTSLIMSPTKKDRAESMLTSGYTQAEVADALGVSLTTLKTAVSGV